MRKVRGARWRGLEVNFLPCWLAFFPRMDIVIWELIPSGRGSLPPSSSVLCCQSREADICLPGPRAESGALVPPQHSILGGSEAKSPGKPVGAASRPGARSTRIWERWTEQVLVQLCQSGPRLLCAGVSAKPCASPGGMGLGCVVSSLDCRAG